MSEAQIPGFVKKLRGDPTLANDLLTASTAEAVISIAARNGLECTAAAITEQQATRKVSRLAEQGSCGNGLRWRTLHGPGGLHIQIVGSQACFGIWCPTC